MKQSTNQSPHCLPADYSELQVNLLPLPELYSRLKQPGIERRKKAVEAHERWVHRQIEKYTRPSK